MTNEQKRERAADAIGDTLWGFYYAEGFDAKPNAHDIVVGVIYEYQHADTDPLDGVSFEECEKIAQTKIDA